MGDELAPTTKEQLVLPAEASLLDLFAAAPSIQLFTQSNPQYAAVRLTFATQFRQQPLAVVRPRTTDEIAATVKFTQAHKLPFYVRNRGSDLAGRGMQGLDGGIMIDMRSFDYVRPEPDHKTARVGGGASSYDVASILEEAKLMSPTGWCAGVGYAGFAMGGGFGFLSSKYGVGADQIVGATAVLADGSVVDTDDHPDLLWALRGAGNGTLAVVAELRIKVYPLLTLLAGVVAYPWADLENITAKYGEVQDDFPENYVGEVMGSEIPGVGSVFGLLFSWIPEEDGDLKEGYEFLAKTIAHLGEPIVNTVTETTVKDFVASIPPFPPSSFALRSRSITGYSATFGKAALPYPPTRTGTGFVMHNGHGAAIRPNPDACFPLRTRHRTIQLVADADNTAIPGWWDKLAADITEAGIALPATYGNLSGPQDFDQVGTYGEETLQRLREIKKRYDPTNVFNKGYPQLA